MALGFKLLQPRYVVGEKDWVYGILSRGRNVNTGDMVSIGSPLTLVVGNGQYADDDEIDYVGPSYTEDEPIEYQPEDMSAVEMTEEPVIYE